jgi:ribokinase
VVLDPGGISPSQDVSGLLREGIYCIKPNEHEARILTGIEVIDFLTAEKAARELQALGTENVLITHGAQGAYLFHGESAVHIPVPALGKAKETDETGCGDQATAVFCSETLRGKSLEEAARLAVYAGTLQFRRKGIHPVRSDELVQAHG